MTEPALPKMTKEFQCVHCQGKLAVPYDLPPTTGPCPHCGGTVTSPANATEEVPMSASEPVLPIPHPVPPQTTAAQSNAMEPVDEDGIDPTPAVDPVRSQNSLMLTMVALVLLALCGTAALFAFLKWGRGSATADGGSGEAVTEAEQITPEILYLRSGWKKDAFKNLDAFIKGQTARDKLPFILGGDAMAERLDDFYGGTAIDDSDTPADVFSASVIPMADLKRGIFMLTYYQPAQFDIKKFFRPIAPRAVELGLERPSEFLAQVAKAENFVSDAVWVMAFFKRTPDGLKLDWETFAQTKYRTLKNFVELPEAGRTGVFRVVLWEDVPPNGDDSSSSRAYSVSDPANILDVARVIVPIDSPVGRKLAELNWRGSGRTQPITRTATVELKWVGTMPSDKDNLELAPPSLEISRFICWEFLGVGGQEESAVKAPHPTPPGGASPAPPAPVGPR